MVRALTAILFITLLSSACTQRTVCPAFQSAYIYDKDVLRKKFSYLKEDSTPKVYSASKTKYLIAEPTTYRKKLRSMQTVQVRPVYVALPDSFKIQEEGGLLGEDSEEGEDGVVPGAELDLAARSVIDSIYIEDVPKQPVATAEDSIYVISKDKEVRVLKYDFPDSLIYDENSGRYVSETPRYAVVHVTFNVDQDNYMWYLRDYLVLPDVRQSKILQMARNEQAKADESAKKKKGRKGFFRNLFGKKKKEEPVEEPPAPKAGDEEEFDFIDEDAPATEAVEPEEQLKEKKGLFRKKNKKEKPPKRPEPEEPEEDQPEKKDDKLLPEPLDEDGF